MEEPASWPHTIAEEEEWLTCSASVAKEISHTKRGSMYSRVHLLLMVNYWLSASNNTFICGLQDG